MTGNDEQILQSPVNREESLRMTDRFDEPPRPLALSLEEPAKEAGGGFAVPPCLDEDIQDLAILIHGPIHIA